MLLMDSNTKTFCIPGTDIEIDKRRLRIFATMNPISVGGGLSSLPRSTANLFTVVTLDEYKPTELQEIVLQQFWKLIHGDESCGAVMTSGQLCQVFELHQRTVEMLSQRRLGRVSGRLEVNLRDLTKMRDVMDGDARDLWESYRFQLGGGESKTREEAPEGSANFEQDIRVISVLKFAKLVHAERFHNIDEQRIVHELLDVCIPLNSSLRSGSCSTTPTRHRKRSWSGSILRSRRTPSSTCTRILREK